MVQNQLVANIRKNRGKSANHKLRQAGKIPATLYGQRGNFMLEMAEESTRHILEKMSGMHEMVTITITDPSNQENWTASVLLREVQKHPYKHKLLHLDFWELPETKTQVVRVPLDVTGESPGVKSGGVLQMVVREIPVSCLPVDIPSKLVVNVSDLEIGDSIKIQEIELPEDAPDGMDDAVQEILVAWTDLTLKDKDVVERLKGAVTNSIDEGFILGTMWFEEFEDGISAIEGTELEKEAIQCALSNIKAGLHVRRDGVAVD